MPTLTRKRIHEIIEIGEKGDRASAAFDVFLVTLILVNVVFVVLESVEGLTLFHDRFFDWFETFSVAVFTIEYALRLWTCVEDRRDRFRDPVWGRLRYMASPFAVIDLLAFLPFYLTLFVTIDLRFLRVLRLLRLLKLTRYSGAAETLVAVAKAERSSLFAAISVMMVMVVMLSGIMYVIEKDAQPVAFGSIPHAMWWGMVTLATVGYGDVVPITPLGKVVGGLITVVGLGMFALPAAIFANGFAREAKMRDFVVTWNLVAQVPPFSRLPAASIAGIAHLLRPRIGVPGEMVVRKGEEADRMFFIVSGEVDVMVEPAPVRLGQGDYFGEMALIFHQPRVANVRVVSSCQLLVLNGEDFERLLAEQPLLREEIEEIANRRLTLAPQVSPRPPL